MQDNYVGLHQQQRQQPQRRVESIIYIKDATWPTSMLPTPCSYEHGKAYASCRRPSKNLPYEGGDIYVTSGPTQPGALVLYNSQSPHGGGWRCRRCRCGPTPRIPTRSYRGSTPTQTHSYYLTLSLSLHPMYAGCIQSCPKKFGWSSLTRPLS